MSARESKIYSSDELLSMAHGVIKNVRFPQLATCDGDQPCVRPISPVRVDGFTIFFANLRRHPETEHIASNPKVEINYLDGIHNQVRITGLAEHLTDALIDEIWANSPLLRKYLGSEDNPDRILYRVRPKRVRFLYEGALDYYELPLLP